MPPQPFGPRQQDESLYGQQIRSLIDRYLNKLLGVDDPLEIAMGLPSIAAGSTFADIAERLARGMVSRQQVQNAKNWREAARRSGYGQRIYAALRLELAGEKGIRIAQLVEENSRLIKSIPRDLAASTAKYIAQEQLAGRRSEDIARDLRKRLPKLARSRVMLIARTEVAKAESVMTEVRSRALGSDWYVWRTSEDAFVRPAHRLFDGVLVNWSDPPSPEAMAKIRSTLGKYHGGRAPNCRCICEAIVNVSEVQWPRKVYSQNTITRMSRAAFIQKFGHRIAA